MRITILLLLVSSLNVVLGHGTIAGLVSFMD